MVINCTCVSNEMGYPCYIPVAWRN